MNNLILIFKKLYIKIINFIISIFNKNNEKEPQEWDIYQEQLLIGGF